MPEELVVEILLRLPPKPLTRFKCVCKSWYALIDDPSSAYKHLDFNKNRSSPRTVSLLLTWKRLVDDYDLFIKKLLTFDTTPSSGDDQSPCVVEDLKLSSIPVARNMDFSRGFHCNGIISLGRSIFTTNFLYNRAIREFKLLPRFLEFRLVVGDGFGYDPKSSDYKFVRIFNTHKSKKCEAQVYATSSGSWRLIRFGVDLELDHRVDEFRGVYCNGVYYWWVTRLQESKDIILPFDISTDKFHGIPLPDNVQRESSNLKTCGVE